MAKTFLACLIVWLAMVATATSAHQHYKSEKLGFNKQDEKSLLRSIVYNATVSKTTPGAHRTLTDALAAAPTHSNTRYYIHVEAGVYVERVDVWHNLTNIVLIGDGAPTTKVRWDRHAPQFHTFETGTISVSGDGFIAMFLTFENTAGDGFQAAAAVTEANNVAYYKCSFLGYQDTLYARSGVQFYRECDIYGTVDFIFGAAAAVFQSCNLYARLPKTITFTAQDKGGPDPSLVSGYVIQNCTLTVAPELERHKSEFVAYLGRPWSNYSTVVVMESYLDSIIKPGGWLTWPGHSTDKVVYLEFKNRGPGAATHERVNWSQDVTGHPEKVQKFTVGEFIDKDGWLGGAGIPYSSGFIYPVNLLALYPRGSSGGGFIDS